MIVTSEHWGALVQIGRESLLRPKLVTNRDKLLLQQSKMSTQSILMFRSSKAFLSLFDINSFLLLTQLYLTKTLGVLEYMASCATLWISLVISQT